MYKGLKGKYHGRGSKVPMSNQTRVYETFTSIYRKRYKHMNRPNLVYRGNKPKEVIKKDSDFIFSPLQGFVLLWRKDLHWFERSTTDEEEVVKVGGSGPIMGLSVTLNSDPGNYYDSHTSSDGIKVIIHKPTTFADASISTHQIYPNHQLHLRLDAMIVRAEPNVKNLDIQQRQCYFSNEQNLAQEYTYQACVAECKMKAMMAKCGCLPFYYPNMFNARECSLKDVPCMKENNGLFTSLGPPNVEHKEFQCNCLSECCEILYEVYPQSAP
ncbi:sodium channel protein Nach-like [Diaphorina citri]|uniref:Sodium channel protein Nach-like n=1 Tax=Diaphorina citri TaxID=121845 RepID=A0A3Q0JDI0_DIACI|nr:sodium channel protein Nach-like [Diaphorina citri]